MPSLRALPLGLAALAAGALTSAASAATLEVVPRTFSPRVAEATVRLELERPRRVGVALVTRDGRRLGWISRPRMRRTLTMRWSGRLGGQVVADGRYRIEVVAPARRLAAASVVVDATAPRLAELDVTSGDRPYEGDGRLLATVSPNRDGLRDRATVRFRLDERAIVTLEVYGARRALGGPVRTITAALGPGRHRLVWEPRPGTPPGTYILRLTATDVLGNRRLYGATRAAARGIPRAPVVRVLGVDAWFTRRSYAPGGRAWLVVAADSRRLSVQILRAGPESEPTFRNDELKGVVVTPPGGLDWRGHRSSPAAVRVRIGDWPSGLYFTRLVSGDGTVGYAPFVVRPKTLGAHRIAVVLPTDTWQAYNFYDADGDGWGDTWYASERIATADLTRPHLNRGVPYRFRSYDLAFLRWLSLRGKEVDFLADEDVERFRRGEDLSAAYDLIVFAGHHEYVTARMYDLVERYRDLGGNLMFLSANNFFWKVDRQGGRLVRRELWRELGRPEAQLIGVQYLANDDGSRQAPFMVTGAEVLPWAFEGTGLENGDTFGLYGIEIDATSPDSPAATHVLAAVPDVFGPGRSAQMTYYETAAGAKVFAAGVLNFGGSVLPVGRLRDPAVTRLLDNLWARLSVP